MNFYFQRYLFAEATTLLLSGSIIFKKIGLSTAKILSKYKNLTPNRVPNNGNSMITMEEGIKYLSPNSTSESPTYSTAFRETSAVNALDSKDTWYFTKPSTFI